MSEPSNAEIVARACQARLDVLEHAVALFMAMQNLDLAKAISITLEGAAETVGEEPEADEITRHRAALNLRASISLANILDQRISEIEGSQESPRGQEP